MKPSFRLGRWAGIPVGAHWSVLGTIAVIGWATAQLVLPSAARGYSSTVYWGAGLAVAVLFFLSLLAHELAHAVVARRRGVRVTGITLWLLGGATAVDDQAPSPGTELRITLAGPLTSLAAGGVFLLGGFWAAAAGWPMLVIAALAWLGGVNVILGLFNLLPAAPLDGGRVLHAVVWRVTGDKDRATAVACRAGSLLGMAMLAFGLFETWRGAFVDGLWLAAIGWYLMTAAGAERAGVPLRRELAAVPVRDVMSTATAAPGWLTVDAFVERIGQQAGQRVFPVVDFTGRPTGVVTLASLARIPRSAWPSTRVTDAQRPAAAVVPADTPVLTLLTSTGGLRNGRLVLVTEHDHLVGVVAAADLARTLELAALRHASSAAGDRRR